MKAKHLVMLALAVVGAIVVAKFVLAKAQGQV